MRYAFVDMYDVQCNGNRLLNDFQYIFRDKRLRCLLKAFKSFRQNALHSFNLFFFICNEYLVLTHYAQ